MRMPGKVEFRFVIGATFLLKPYVARYSTIGGFEVSWLGLYFQLVIVPKPRVIGGLL